MRIGMACNQADKDLKVKVKDYLESIGHEVIDFETDHTVTIESLDCDILETQNPIILNELPEIYGVIKNAPYVRSGFIIFPFRALLEWSEKEIMEQISYRLRPKDYLKLTLKVVGAIRHSLKKIKKFCQCIKKEEH